MAWQYQTTDGTKFLRELEAETYEAEQKDIPTREANQFIEEITEEHKEDEDTMEVKKFRVVEYWSCERTVTVKAVNKDHAEERADEKIVNQDMVMSHKVQDEIDDLGKVEEVPRKKIESGEYFEDDE